MNKINLEKVNIEFKDKSPDEIIQYAINEFGISKITIASSLSIEDQMLTDIILKIDGKARIFILDTGRHFQETYDLMDMTSMKYGFKYEVFMPDRLKLEQLISRHGANLFYESPELRKKCCEIRKVEPLARALSSADAWICGLRREQSQTRQDVQIFEWDENHSIFKINPLSFLSELEVWEYIKKEKVPYNTLYQKGFRSIGCQPCTRSIKEDEDIRCGRWWWESPDKKECGLHTRRK